MDIDTDRLVKALRQFGACDEKNIPTNAATLWRQLVEGVNRVAKSLSKD